MTPAPVFTVGILETGVPPEDLAARYGRYDAMVRRMLGDGFDYQTYRVRDGDLPEAPDAHPAYVITGSSAGVYDDLPWIAPLEDFIRAVHGRARMVGVCFGHQVMAQALGGRVEKSSKGWGLGLHGYAVDAPQPLSVQCEVAPDLLAACAGLRADDILLRAHAPVLASTGNPLVFAACAAEALAAAAPSLAGFRDAVQKLPALEGRLGLCFYARDRHRIRSRMFSPLDGTWEDPATGSAATTLAALLLSLGGENRQEWEIVQGIEMQRPSLLRAWAWRDGAAIRATVAGRCVPVLRGEALLER